MKDFGQLKAKLKAMNTVKAFQLLNEKNKPLTRGKKNAKEKSIEKRTK